MKGGHAVSVLRNSPHPSRTLQRHSKHEEPFKTELAFSHGLLYNQSCQPMISMRISLWNYFVKHKGGITHEDQQPV